MGIGAKVQEKLREETSVLSVSPGAGRQGFIVVKSRIDS
jgi:hypothetical protein